MLTLKKKNNKSRTEALIFFFFISGKLVKFFFCYINKIFLGKFCFQGLFFTCQRRRTVTFQSSNIFP